MSSDDACGANRIRAKEPTPGLPAGVATALNRAMLNIHVEAVERPSNFPGCRQTSRNTSLIKSSAVASLRTRPQYKPVRANMVPRVQHLHGEPTAPAIREIRTSSEVVCIAEQRLVHGSLERAPRFKPNAMNSHAPARPRGPDGQFPPFARDWASTSSKSGHLAGFGVEKMDAVSKGRAGLNLSSGASDPWPGCTFRARP
jgi:hypothetical protein